MSLFNVVFRDNLKGMIELMLRTLDECSRCNAGCSNLMFSLFPFFNIFDVELLSGPRWYELQVDTAGEEFLDALMCDFK